MLDELLAYKLGDEVMKAMLEIDLCKQGKKHTWQSLETLTWTFAIECGTDNLKSFQEDTSISIFFWNMFKDMRKREYKTIQDLFPDVQDEINNLLAILSSSAYADLERGMTFCIELHRYILPLQGPRRRHLAA